MKARGLTRETILSYNTKALPFPIFSIGDTIAVSQRIVEGDKKRIQIFEGDVIGMHQNGVSSTFTVRKIGANNIAVERVFPFQTPAIESIKVVRRGKVRRAKLYYIRGRVGKASRVAEKILTKEQKAALAQASAEAMQAAEAQSE